ncbi:MAG TPA: sigma-70 family RNA polymerase sigma factor [Planctomycetota bacterium]|jgi:RNA polymerase sigma-70 factor (ECF subfamily)
MDSGVSSQEEVIRLLVRYQSMLLGYLYALTEDWEIAEEALQETSVFICARWQDYTPGTRFGAWARTVARLRAKEVLRARSRGVSLDEGCLADVIEDHTWEQHGSFSAEQKAALAKCIEALPRHLRRMMDLHYRKQYDGQKLAALLEKSVESIYMTLSRTRQKLRECVDRRLLGDPESAEAVQ